MTGEVVGIRGDVVPFEYTPDPNVIAHLEWMLEAAKSGQLTGIAAVYQWEDKTAGYRRAGLISYRMIGILESMKTHMIKDLEP